GGARVEPEQPVDDRVGERGVEPDGDPRAEPGPAELGDDPRPEQPRRPPERLGSASRDPGPERVRQPTERRAQPAALLEPRQPRLEPALSPRPEGQDA